MKEKSLFKLADFNSVCKKNIFLYEASVMDSIGSAGFDFTKKVALKSVNMGIVPITYLQDQIDVWSEVLKRKDELDEFFSNIYNNTDFNTSLATTIPIYDVSEVRGVKPQYLVQYVNKSIKILNDAVSGKNVDVVTFCSDKELDSLKRSLVPSRLPDYLDDNQILRFDNRRVVQVNSSYITGTLLPFIRSSEYEKKNTVQNANDCVDAVERCINYINDAGTALDRVSDRITNRNACYKIFTRLTSNFLHASKYMIAGLMRKIYIYTANMKEYCGLKDGLIDTFQNGADILHESVIDGSYDFRDEDIVVTALKGRSDITDAVIDRIFSKFRSYLSEYQPREFGDDLHSLIDVQIENAPFDIQLYKALLNMEKTIFDMIRSIIASSDNSELSIEDIQSEAGLNQSILTTFANVLMLINRTNAYDLVDGVSEYDRCMSILNELEYGKKFFVKFNRNMKIIYDDFSEFKKSIQRNDNDKFENHERNKEEILFLEAFEKDLRQLLLQLGRDYLSRLMSLEDILIHNESELSGTAPEQLDIDCAEDYISDALSANEDMDTSVIEAMSADMLYNFEKAFYENATIASPILFFEDGEQPAQNQNGGTPGGDTNNNQNGNQTGTNTSQNNTSPKPSVVDNSNGNQNNNSEKKTGALGNVIQALKNFISNITQKITNAITKGKANLAWVEENEDALRKRSYSNISINVVPYAENISYSELIGNCAREINSWKSNPVGKTEEQVMQKMLKNMPSALTKSKDGSWNDSLVNGLKYGKGKVGETVTYSNAAIVAEVGKMIDYCKNYYTRFNKDIENSTDSLLQAVSDLEKRNPDNKKVGNGMSAEETITFMLKMSTTLTGIIANVARDRVNDYLSILRDLVPNNKKKNNNQNNNQQQNNQNNDNPM